VERAFIRFNNGQTGERGGVFRKTIQNMFVEVGVIDTVSVLRYIANRKIENIPDLIKGMIAERFNLHVVTIGCA
jgi:hypothetical protein